MKNTVNWSVPGTAAIATSRTMPALNAAPSATLLALASRDAARGKACAEFLLQFLIVALDAPPQLDQTDQLFKGNTRWQRREPVFNPIYGLPLRCKGAVASGFRIGL